VLCIAIVAVKALFSGGTFTSTEDGFSQSGVKVTYSSGQIQIKGRTYPVSEVRGLRWDSKKKNGDICGYSKAYISVSDIQKPIYTLHFRTMGAAEVFCERLELAIQKAGGPTFEP
jgi:hypothetical protein